MIDLGERIKYIRTTYDMTQIDLAKLFKISKSSISHMEHNDRVIPTEHLIFLSDHLNLSIDYILGLTNQKNYDDRTKGISLENMANHFTQISNDLNVSNIKMGEILNSSESNIRNYKKGKYLILTSFALELSLKYHYSFDYIVGKTNQKYY